MGTKKDYSAVLQNKQGIKLDIGCGNDPMPGFVGMDILDLPNVDIVWDLENTPWPLPDECVLSAVASHILEHIQPGYGDHRVTGLKKLLLKKGLVTEEELDEYCGLDGSAFINVMNEVWRVLKPGAQFAFVVPHASSSGYEQDPTHVNMINQNTMRYFDPLDASKFYHFYQPKPWEVQFQSYDMGGNLEVVLRKRKDDPSYHNASYNDIVDEFTKSKGNFIRTVRSM
jgi:SAM-dependent methyltransferase